MNKYPPVIVSLFLIFGILFSSFVNLSGSIGFYSSIFQLIFLLLILISYKGFGSFQIIRMVIYTASIFLFGFFSFQSKYWYKGDEYIGRNDSLFNTQAVFYGMVNELPEKKQEQVKFIFDCDSVTYNGKTQEIDGTILTTVYKNKYAEDKPFIVHYGDNVSLTGILEKLKSERNPGEFDYGEYLKLHGIDASLRIFGYDKLQLIGESNVNPVKKHVLYPFKKYASGMIDELIGGEEAQFLKGLVLGDRSNISKQVREDFVNAGVAHIIAVSGLNVAYMLILLNILLLFLPIKNEYKFIITLFFLYLYSNLTGNSPSIIRASIMAGVFLFSRLIERKPDSYNILGVSAIIILLIDPQQLFDAGFQLSFAAILSLIIIYPVLMRKFAVGKLFMSMDTDKWYNKTVKWIIILLLGTAAAQLGTLPLTALMFKKISVVSFFTNLIAIPISNIALALGFIIVAVSSFSLWLASVFAGAAKVILYFLLLFINYFAKLDFSYIEIFGFNFLLIICSYSFLLILLTTERTNYIPRIFSLLMIIFIFVVYNNILSKRDGLILTYLDTGRSNCTLARFPGGTTVLFNCGGSTGKYIASERHIIPFLKSSKIAKVDLLIMTSLKHEEFVSLVYLAKHFEIRKIILPVYYSSLFNDYDVKKLIIKMNLEFISSSKILNSKGNFRIYITYDSSVYKGKSLQAELVYGSNSFVFNDTKEPVEDYLFSQTLVNNQTTVLKVPSTGSFSFTSPGYVSRSDPEYIVISSSEKSKKSLHSDVFSDVLNRAGYKVLKTSAEGAIIFECDGKDVRKVEWR
jgi:competence protein ComEC